MLGTDLPYIPYDYATQLRAIAGWAAADDRLGIPFLHAVVRDTPARLLRLPAAGSYHGVVQPDKGVNGFDSGR